MSRCGARRTPSPACIMEETEAYDVPLMVARGYALDQLPAQRSRGDRGERQARLHLSTSAISTLAARTPPETSRPNFGVMHPEAEIHFERIAVTQRTGPKRGTYHTADKAEGPRAKKFNGKSVELDAIPANETSLLGEGLHRAARRSRTSSRSCASPRNRSVRHSPSGRGWSGVLRHDPAEEATSAIEELSGRPQRRASARSRALWSRPAHGSSWRPCSKYAAGKPID